MVLLRIRYIHQQFSIQKVAHYIGMSVSTLQRIFKGCSGTANFSMAFQCEFGYPSSACMRN